jgi:uncharacterized peroxidase-related enzyme
MPYVRTVPVDAAAGLVRQQYDSDLAEDGYVSNMTQLFSLRPEVYVAWGQLRDSIRGNMDLRRYELATLAAARALRCRCCVGAHAAVLESKFYDRRQLEAIMRNFRDAGLDDVEVAIMGFAERVALHAYRVTSEDVEALRGHGLSDAEIFDVALAAALRCFFSKVLDSMGAEPDEVYADSATLLELVELPEPAAAAAPSGTN